MRPGRSSRAAFALAASPLAQSHEITFTAVSANVKEPGSPVRIRLNRWSTDEERNSVIATLNPPATAAAPDGAATADLLRPAGAAQGQGASGEAADGAEAAAADRGAALSPIAALTARRDRSRHRRSDSSGRTQVAGVLNRVRGSRTALATGGGERIVVATNRRLGGGWSAGWATVLGE